MILSDGSFWTGIGITVASIERYYRFVGYCQTNNDTEKPK